MFPSLPSFCALSSPPPLSKFTTNESASSRRRYPTVQDAPSSFSGVSVSSATGATERCSASTATTGFAGKQTRLHTPSGPLTSGRAVAVSRRWGRLRRRESNGGGAPSLPSKKAALRALVRQHLRVNCEGRRAVGAPYFRYRHPRFSVTGMRFAARSRTAAARRPYQLRQMLLAQTQNSRVLANPAELLSFGL